ncbi:MAG: polysaccharide ABC transporter ATP-binding protein [Lacunisphaera sp.]
MDKPVIHVENLGKKYYLSHQGRTDTLRDSLTQSVRDFFHKRPSSKTGDREEFWALRDVSFDVNRGDVVGIIGRNGAGKSTLLKILSRITEPTTGRAVIRGRVASLLEVGTGFHPELSGRENIFLNGAILGMSRTEITRKFDEIVAFAEVERFLDTQVKHYSSGMYVRLAFAVAAHLEPEILIVDEVLAVGDLQFQRKCLGKMKEVAGGGRTILFVSHNMAAVQRLCTRGVYLKQGNVAMAGQMNEVIDRYMAEASGPDGQPASYARRHPAFEVGSVELLINGESRHAVAAGATLTFRLHYRCTAPADFPDGLECGFIVFGQGQKLANFWSNAGLGHTMPVAAHGTISCTVPAWPFRTMPMSVQVHLNYRRETLVDLPEALAFDSLDSDRFGTGIVPDASEGIVLLPHQWESATLAPSP